MNQPGQRTICVGEATVELARGSDGRFTLGCGGDTFNTAIYLARAGLATAFASALGDDLYSDSIVSLATVEGVATDLVTRVPGRLPGVALIETVAKDKRRFHDWRETAPACDLFELPDWSRIAEGIAAARLV
jgi:2-dehydro-3-deoxygluconokinase